MAISQDLAILNLMQTLDNFLASMRNRVDNQDPYSVIQILNVLRCQNFGKDIDIFNKGIIFGCSASQVKNLGETWGISYGQQGPDESLTEGENAEDWVITRGNIFDGTRIINIEPSEGVSYVYKISPIITEKMVNFLIPGAVFYSTTTHSFRTILSGQVNINYPVVAIEKTGISQQIFIDSFCNYKYFNNIFKIDRNTNDINLCNFLVDVNSINDYNIYILNNKDLYPFIFGQPYYKFMYFSKKINDYISDAIIDGYDSSIIYNLMYYIVNAAVWGSGATPFYTYWTTGGRVLPSNVKYYYNILFTPTIS